VTVEPGGWGAISARRVTAFFGQAEDRPVPTRAALSADVVIAAVATIAAIADVILQVRSPGRPFGLLIPRPVGLPVVRRLAPPSHTGLGPGLLLGTILTTAPLAFRRIYPIAAFCVILAAVIGVTGNETGVTFVAVVFAAYSAVANSKFRRLAMLAVLAGAGVVTAAFPGTTPQLPSRFTPVLIMLPTVAVAVASRVWRARARESAERLRRAQAEHEAQTRRAIALERARIASEMHDVVTHNVSVMVVQAGAARRMLDSSPDDTSETGLARQALLAVETSGRTAMTELRHLLGLLAPPGGDEADAGGAGPADNNAAALDPQPGLAQVPSLVERVRAAGLPVELSVTGARELPPGLDLAAYRVVQEALTNVIKHAGQVRTQVGIEYRLRDLRITVSDDGRQAGSASAAPVPGPPGPAAGSGSGRGLIGMRERIAVYGGDLDAGPRPGGGWRVAVRVPLEGAAGLPATPEYQAVSQ
jgi:signal transduction histidine kinase